jgi:hypothetical protein
MRKSRTDRTSLLPAGRLVGLLVGFVVGHRCLGEARLSPRIYLIRNFLGKRVALFSKILKHPMY